MEDDEVSTRTPIRRRRRRRRRRCNLRLHELATPQKRMFLALWNEHAHNLPPEKVDKLKELLQLYYAMTPEETAKYFAELRAQAKAAARRRRLKQKLRKYLTEKRNQKKKERAYCLFKKILKSGIRYAAMTQVPPLVSIRLRYLSDIILEQLCVLRRLGVPNRGNTDELGNFLISVADWMAIAVERLYYSTQLTVNEMTADVYGQQPPDGVEVADPGAPVASSTPRSSIQSRQVPPPEKRRDSKVADPGPPVASSTPRSSIQSRQVPPPEKRRDSRRSSGGSETSKRSRRLSQASGTKEDDARSQRRATVDSVQSSKKRSSVAASTSIRSRQSASSSVSGSLRYESIRPFYSIIEPPASTPAKVEVKSHDPHEIEQMVANFEMTRSSRKGKGNSTSGYYTASRISNTTC